MGDYGNCKKKNSFYCYIVPLLNHRLAIHYPKWKVKVNGKEEKIYRADYAFRAVVVPQGESIVEFYYSGLF